MLAEPAHTSSEERRRRFGALSGEHLDVCEAAVVVDADARAIAVDAMANLPESPEFLDVQVQQLARSLALVANAPRGDGTALAGLDLS